MVMNDKPCPKINHPKNCQKCLSIATALSQKLSLLTEEEIKKVKEITHALQNCQEISETDVSFLYELSGKYLD